MERGLEELLVIARWALKSQLQLKLTPVRHYFSPERGKEVVQVSHGSFEGWM
jgi:hypothetical protein